MRHECACGAVVDSSELGSYNGRFIQVFSYAKLGGLHYAHPLDLVVMLARPAPVLCCRQGVGICMGYSFGHGNAFWSSCAAHAVCCATQYEQQ